MLVASTPLFYIWFAINLHFGLRQYSLQSQELFELFFTLINSKFWWYLLTASQQFLLPISHLRIGLPSWVKLFGYFQEMWSICMNISWRLLGSYFWCLSSNSIIQSIWRHFPKRSRMQTPSTYLSWLHLGSHYLSFLLWRRWYLCSIPTLFSRNAWNYFLKLDGI